MAFLFQLCQICVYMKTFFDKHNISGHLCVYPVCTIPQVLLIFITYSQIRDKEEFRL